MSHISIHRSLWVMVAIALGLFSVLILVLSLTSIVLADPTGNFAFGGEAEDHNWSLTTRFCTNGFTIDSPEVTNPLTQTPNHPGVVYYNGDVLPFSLQLGSSTAPVLQPVPSPLAGGVGGGPGRALATGHTTFLFTQPQAVGALVTITIERWDHGTFSPYETNTDDSDHSIDWDDIWPFKFAPPPPPNRVENCTVAVDRVPPTTTPAGQASTSGVTITLNATDNPGGSGVKMIEYQATGAQPISRTMHFGNSVSLPISAPGVTTLAYFAWDNADNPELNTLAAPKTLTVNVTGKSSTIRFGNTVYLPLMIR